MNQSIRTLVCVCCVAALPAAVSAQSHDVIKAYSIAGKTVGRVEHPVDSVTAAFSGTGLIPNRTDTLPVSAVKAKARAAGEKLKNEFSGKDAASQAGGLRQNAAEKLWKIKNPAPSLLLTLEDMERYQPVPPAGFAGSSRFVNVFTARGTLTAYGVPVNLDYTTDKATSMLPAGAAGNLFKFDLVPGGLSQLYRSRLQQYLDVRRNLFGGMDLSAYTRMRMEQQLSNGKDKLYRDLNKDALSGYLNSPSGMQELLGMDKQSIIDKLRMEAVKKTTELQLSAREKVLDRIASGSALQEYLNNPANIKEVALMSEGRLREKISEMAISKADSLMSDGQRDSVVNAVTRRVMIAARQNGRVDLKKELAEEKDTYAASLDVEADPGRLQQYTAIAESITSVKNEIARSGLDIHQMLAMQQYLDNGTGYSGMSEFSNAIVQGSPVNAAQKLFGRLDAFKLGAYSQHVPGGVGNQDLFLKGGHATVKTGIVPLTFGYGSVSDINSLKDQGFEGSAYNQPRNVTFIGAELKQPGRGSVKLSVVSSLSRQLQNSAYSMPSISSNNVSYTVSKEMRAGKLGTLDLDVSKSTTLYSNKFQAGAEAILDTKNGLQYDLGRDLFQSLSFGINHHLDLKEIGTSDNVYFSYSGMGYQNPADNGFGGAKMKVGGNIRKSFGRNKLNFIVRTDLGSMPISYTSDDRWKTYQFQLDTRYALTKKTNLNLNLTTNGTDKSVAGINSRVYTFQKMQLNGNTSYRIGKLLNVSNFGLGTQSITGPAIGAGQTGSSRLLLMTYVQSMVIRKNVVTFNMFYNRELSGVKLIGNMLNTDLACQYMLFGKLSMSSGLTYLENTGVVKQAGIRQNVQLLSAGHFDFGTSLDLRKDMIRPLYSALYPSCRAEINLKYHLNAF